MTDKYIVDLPPHDSSLSATVTISIATPAVVSWTGHPLAINQAFTLATTGALPTGITAGVTYYVSSASFGASSFQFSATPGGASINTSGTQSGTQTIQGLPADDTLVEVQRSASSTATEKISLSSLIKAYVKSWIAKADVGLGNVTNNAQLTIANNLSDVNALTARANLGVSVMRPIQLTAKYFTPPGIGNSSSAGATASGRLHLIPFIPRRTVTIDRFFTRVSSGSAGNWQGGIYNSHATTLMPTTLVGNGGSGSTTTSSTWTESLLSGGSGSNITLQEGALYWLGVNVDNTVAAFATVNAGNAGLAAELIGDATNSNVIQGGGQSLVGYYTAMTFGTWTSDITASSFTPIPVSCPLIGWKAV